eukprot:1525062-Pleurochrysis_carterae.AAC.1
MARCFRAETASPLQRLLEAQRLRAHAKSTTFSSSPVLPSFTAIFSLRARLQEEPAFWLLLAIVDIVPDFYSRYMTGDEQLMLLPRLRPVRTLSKQRLD